MDKTVRTIRKAIEEAGKGLIPSIVLIVDTNILVDVGWSRDQNTDLLIEYATKAQKSLVCCPCICAIEFKKISIRVSVCSGLKKNWSVDDIK